jgi:hypothetical protein
MQFKHFTWAFALLFALASCQKDADTAPATPGPDPNPNPDLSVTVLKTGSFTGQNGYPASGTAQIVRNVQQQHFTRLASDFKTSFATGSVTMYLSKHQSLRLNEPATWLKLAVINQNGQHDFAVSEAQSNDFQYVIVWCAPAGIQFGWAELR